MAQYNVGPFSDYGYIEQKEWIGRREQLQEQGMETDYYVDFGVGFVPGSPEPTEAGE